MKLEAGQVWQLDTQEEFDAFVKLKDDQGIEWMAREWTLVDLKLEGDCTKLVVRENDDELICGNTSLNATHYGKDLLKEGNVFKVGDRVKVVKGSSLYREKEGKIVKIVDKQFLKYEVVFDEDVNTAHFAEDELEYPNEWVEVEREEVQIGSKPLRVEQNVNTKELYFIEGYFTGTLDEFETAVKRKPEGDKHRVVYEWLIEKYKAKYPDYKKKVAYVVKLNERVWYARGGVLTDYVEEASHFDDKTIADEYVESFGGTVEEVEL